MRTCRLCGGTGQTAPPTTKDADPGAAGDDCPRCQTTGQEETTR
jgi:hypothetical protein